jgi:hypothetical protein
VLVSGRVTLYQGSAQMEVSSPSQIRVIASR